MIIYRVETPCCNTGPWSYGVYNTDCEHCGNKFLDGILLTLREHAGSRHSPWGHDVPDNTCFYRIGFTKRIDFIRILRGVEIDDFELYNHNFVFNKYEVDEMAIERSLPDPVQISFDVKKSRLLKSTPIDSNFIDNVLKLVMRMKA